MEILSLLIPLALLLSGTGLGLFVWAVYNSQFDDLEGPAWRLLFEQEER